MTQCCFDVPVLFLFHAIPPTPKRHRIILIGVEEKKEKKEKKEREKKEKERERRTV